MEGQNIYLFRVLREGFSRRLPLTSRAPQGKESSDKALWVRSADGVRGHCVGAEGGRAGGVRSRSCPVTVIRNLNVILRPREATGELKKVRCLISFGKIAFGSWENGLETAGEKPQGWFRAYAVFWGETYW